MAAAAAMRKKQGLSRGPSMARSGTINLQRSGSPKPGSWEGAGLNRRPSQESAISQSRASRSSDGSKEHPTPTNADHPTPMSVGGTSLLEADVTSRQTSKEQQATPLLSNMEPSSHGESFVQAPEGDQDQEVHWAESGWFQTLGAVVITFNAVLLGLETDIESPLWWYLEQLLLLFFVFELLVRMRLIGLSFLSCSNPDIAWNMLDFVIVLSAVLDQWIRPLLLTEEKGKSNFGQAMMLMRMLRLMRILRLLRLVKAVRPLYKLAIGIVAAMQSMVWVLVLTFLGIYAFSIFTTRLIGHSQIVDDPEDLDVKTHIQFATIPQSMFTLFEIMTS